MKKLSNALILGWYMSSLDDFLPPKVDLILSNSDWRSPRALAWWMTPAYVFLISSKPFCRSFMDILKLRFLSLQALYSRSASSIENSFSDTPFWISMSSSREEDPKLPGLLSMFTVKLRNTLSLNLLSNSEKHRLYLPLKSNIHFSYIFCQNQKYTLSLYIDSIIMHYTIFRYKLSLHKLPKSDMHYVSNCRRINEYKNDNLTSRAGHPHQLRRRHWSVGWGFLASLWSEGITGETSFDHRGTRARISFCKLWTFQNNI